MNGMQDKVMGEFQRLVEAGKLDFVVQPHVSNGGYVLIQRGWSTIAVIAYQFNQTYASIGIARDVEKAKRAQATDWRSNQNFGRCGSAKIDYADTDRLMALFAWVEAIAQEPGDAATTDS